MSTPDPFNFDNIVSELHPGTPATQQPAADPSATATTGQSTAVVTTEPTGEGSPEPKINVDDIAAQAINKVLGRVDNEATQARQQAEAEAQWTNQLSEFYGFGAEESDLFDERQRKILVDRQTKMHKAIIASVGQMLMQSAPVLFQNLYKQQRTSEEAETSFFGMFPEIKKHPKGIETATSIGRALRADPETKKMTPAEFQRTLGIATYSLLGLPLPQASASPEAAPDPVQTAIATAKAGTATVRGMGGGGPAPTNEPATTAETKLKQVQDFVGSVLQDGAL